MAKVSTKPVSRCRAISRVELLKLCELVDKPEDANHLAALLGYGYAPLNVELSDKNNNNIEVALPGLDSSEVLLEQVRPNIQLWFVESYIGRGSAQATPSDIKSIITEYQLAPSCAPLLRLEPSPAQVQSWLQQLLKAEQQGYYLDVKAAVCHISKNQVLGRWPYQARSYSQQEVVIILDHCQHLSPLSNDYKDVLGQLKRHLGVQGCHIIHFNGQDIEDLGLKYLPAESRVLLLSDLGCFSSLAMQEHWDSLTQCLIQDGHTLRVLAPSLLVEQTRKFACVAMGVKSNSQRVQAIMCAMAFCLHPTTDTLRYIRQQLLGASVADELAVWGHTDVCVRAAQWQLKSNFQVSYFEGFLLLPEQTQNLLLQALLNLQQSQAEETQGLQQMLMYQYGLLAQPPEPKLFAAIVTSSPFNPKSLQRSDSLLHDTQKLLMAADKLKSHPDYQHIYERAQQVAIHFQQPLPLGPRANDQLGEAVLYFNQKNNHIQVSETSKGIATFFTHSQAVVVSQVGTQIKAPQVFTSETLMLTSELANIGLTRMEKPLWAKAFWREAKCIFAEHEEGAIFQLHEANTELEQAYWQCIKNPWQWASNTGVDEFGLWLEFELGSVCQRMRWINPGEFLMGSPEDEPEREEDEVPHKAVLTEGYWLADTACTQALWQAAMGKNPSLFKNKSDSPERPVERVSWDDCKQMIDKLNGSMVGLELRLPSETEWEYACRAGTATAFSFGDSLHTGQANFNGNFPYNNGKEGKCREQTTVVKSFSLNDWGLYQMHGNVWEWCQDYHEEYDGRIAIDPTGPLEGSERVLRGGGWDYDGWGLRSSFRHSAEPDDCGYDIGFRFARGLTTPK